MFLATGYDRVRQRVVGIFLSFFVCCVGFLGVKGALILGSHSVGRRGYLEVLRRGAWVLRAIHAGEEVVGQLVYSKLLLFLGVKMMINQRYFLHAYSMALTEGLDVEEGKDSV